MTLRSLPNIKFTARLHGVIHVDKTEDKNQSGDTMKKMLRDLIDGECFKSFNADRNVIVARTYPNDLPRMGWSYGALSGYPLSDQTREVELVPSYRTAPSEIQAVTFVHLPAMPPKEIAPSISVERFPPKLTAAECLSRYQVGMQTERVRTVPATGGKYIIASIPGSDDGLTCVQFLAAQAEFTRVVREKAEEAKRIKAENEMVYVQRDVDYFGE